MMEKICDNGDGWGAVLTDAQAKLEASRCLMCDDPPCVQACPAQVPVKHFIRAIRFDNPQRAINLIREQNVCAGICGLACPVEKLCVGACRSTDLTTPVSINRLQHYAAVKGIGRGGKASKAASSGKKVAIVGGGPSGLAAAAELARAGHAPTIFERHRLAGGITTYGVPAHRLPQELVAAEVAYVQSLGVEIRTGIALGVDFTVDDLFKQGFSACYVSVGLQEAITPGLAGEELQGVIHWKELLDGFSAYNLGEGERPSVPNSVVVVGGGSVAMDVASAARQLGAMELDVVCLESPCEMPADAEEMEEVWNLGARFHTRSMPLEVTGEKGKVTGLKAQRIRWQEPERFVPANAELIKETEYWLPAEMVVFAIGARASGDIGKAISGVEFGRGGRIVVDEETLATSRPGVYAGGDAVVDGGMTIVKSVAEGKRAGQAIDVYLRGQAGDNK